MIKLYTGIPGSGKSYRVTYELKQNEKKYYVLHNIKGLVESEIDEGKHIKRFSELGDFFTIFNHDSMQAISEQIQKKYGLPILIIIDECADYMGRELRFHEDFNKWLRYHRHFGQDIWLVCHDRNDIRREYHSLIEIEIRAKKGYVLKSFVYTWLEHGQVIKTDKLPKDKRIFSLYRSFQVEETVKGKSFLIKGVILLFVCALVMICYFLFYKAPQMFNKKVSKGEKSILDSSSHSLHKNNALSVLSSSPSSAPVEQNGVDYFYIGAVFGRVVVSDRAGSLWYLDEITAYKTENIKDGVAMVIDPDKGALLLRNQPISSIEYPAAAERRATQGASKNGSMSENAIKRVVIIR